MALSKIIGDEVLPQIDSALSNIAQLETELQLAERAGLTSLPQAAVLKELGKKAEESKAILLQIKQVYFPGQ